MRAKKFKQYCPDFKEICDFDHQQDYTILDGKLVSIDRDLKDTIVALNKANLPTFASCIGSKRHGGYVLFSKEVNTRMKMRTAIQIIQKSLKDKYIIPSIELFFEFDSRNREYSVCKLIVRFYNSAVTAAKSLSI